MFLFKLHAPRNVIVGGGIFAYANALPCSLAWEAFGEANGARSAQEMRAHIAKYRRADPDDRSDFPIGWARPAVNLKPSSIATLPSSQKVLARPRWQQAMTPRDYAACDAVDREPREPLRPF